MDIIVRKNVVVVWRVLAEVDAKHDSMWNSATTTSTTEQRYVLKTMGIWDWDLSYSWAGFWLRDRLSQLFIAIRPLHGEYEYYMFAYVHCTRTVHILVCCMCVCAAEWENKCI